MMGKKLTETNMRPAYYASIYPLLRNIALGYHYSLAIHGSLLSDMDLIAIPWSDSASDEHYPMLKAMGKMLGEEWTDEYISKMSELKPHGRIAYSLGMDGGGTYLDISFMPAMTKPRLNQDGGI